jgi:hypothetical protein
VIALVLAEENDVYLDMVIKFLEQFVMVARALEQQGLYDPEDGFFYDRLVYPGGETKQVRVQTIGGLLPALPAVGLPPRATAVADRLGKRLARLRQTYEETGGTMIGRVRQLGDDGELTLLSVIDPEALRHALEKLFDETAFLSPHGLRALSKRYENNPYTLEGVEGAWLDYEPAESTTTMFGGNSNWRGPVWMPVNYLVIRDFVLYHRFFGETFKLEYPTGSGRERTFDEIAQDLADRLLSIWLPAPDGRRPVYGAHQTGWTALVADLILDPPSAGLQRLSTPAASQPLEGERPI